MIKTLFIQNFCGIETMRIDLSAVNIMYGRNMQGKTTILEAIKWLVNGDNDDSYIRKGTETCEVTAEFINGDKAERRLTVGGKSKLYVCDISENQIPEPQTYIKNTLGFVSPISLMSMTQKDLGQFVSKAMSDKVKFTPEEMKEYCLEDLDFSGGDTIQVVKKYYDTLYSERTAVNKEVKASEGVFNQDLEVPSDEKINAVKGEVEAIKKKIEEISINNARAEAAKKSERVFEMAKSDLADIEKELAELQDLTPFNQEEFDALTKELKALETSYSDTRSQYAGIKDALKKIDGQITCPFGIKCKTDFSSYKDQLTGNLGELEENGKEKFSNISVIKEKLQTLDSARNTAELKKNLEVRAERTRAILNEAAKVGSTEQVSDAEYRAELSGKQNQLSKWEVNKEIQKKNEAIIKHARSRRQRQAELNDLLPKLKNLIEVEIPSRMNIGVKGLLFSDEGFTYNGLKFARLGDSYKLRLCIAIIKSLMPKTSVMLLDRCECIDPIEFEKFLARLVKENGSVQYLMTYVGNDIPNTPGISAFEIAGFKAIKKEQ